MNRRVFIVVLDSFGIGEAPDAAAFGDAGANTLRSIAGSEAFCCPQLTALGLFHIDGVNGKRAEAPLGAFGRLREKSMGKDTTIGHWELAGVESPVPLPTYPNGFPAEIMDAFCARTGRAALCNLPYSGTQVIRDYGEQHLRTGALIVYTSADSVFQIAAHEAVVPVEQLYAYCRAAREILTGEHGVGRVIARPFAGKDKTDFYRTQNRHDFSLKPPAATLLDVVSGAGRDVIAVGKINDIFAGCGVTKSIHTSGNSEGQRVLLELAQTEFNGLAFVNLVDFDMLYGHRRDVPGYAAAMTAFDKTLAQLLPLLREQDLLLLTADHGCDPAFLKTTDHTREYVPLLAYGARVARGAALGTVNGFGAVGVTACAFLGLDAPLQGENLWPRMEGN